MSNPQDSPKTVEELVALIRDGWTNTLHPLYDTYEFELNAEKAAGAIQSYIDAQKAEVTEDHIAFACALIEAIKNGTSTKLSEAHPCPKCGELSFYGYREDDCFFCMAKRVLAEALATRDQKLVQEQRDKKNQAYWERNQLVAALSKVFPAYLLEHEDKEGEDWDPKWRFVVAVELPTGQVTWHVEDTELPHFAHLTVRKDKRWDGHTTTEKYDRLERLSTEAIGELVQEAVKPWREALSKAHQALQAIIGGNARLEPVVGSMVLSAAKCFKPRVLGRDDVLQDGDEVRLLGHGPAVYEPVADQYIGRPVGDKADKFEYRRPLLSHEAWAEVGNRALLSQPQEVK